MAGRASLYIHTTRGRVTRSPQFPSLSSRMGIAIRSTEVPRWCVAAGEGPREATESLRSIQVQAGAARPGGMHGERGAVAPRRGEERAAGPGGSLGHSCYYSAARAQYDVAVVAAALTRVVCATDPMATPPRGAEAAAASATPPAPRRGTARPQPLCLRAHRFCIFMRARLNACALLVPSRPVRF